MDPGAVASDRKGLTEREAHERLKRSGPNRITPRHEITFPGIVKEEITDPMILLLLGVAVFYSILGSMVIWAVGALAFLTLLLKVPAAGERFGLTRVSAMTVLGIAGFAFICMAGFELVKIVKRRESRAESVS